MGEATLKFLLDKSTDVVQAKGTAFPSLVSGQLLTPLSRYKNWGGQFAVDNGAFSKFDAAGFKRLLDRNKRHRKQCLFVAAPDVVGSARRTLECFNHWYPQLESWPVALVAQDGAEDLSIPWDLLSAIFIGGSDWKDSKAAADIVKTALIMGIHVHVGRVNTIRRYRRLAELGAHTSDGSGASRYDWMLEAIAAGLNDDAPVLPGFGGAAHENGGTQLRRGLCCDSLGREAGGAEEDHAFGAVGT